MLLAELKAALKQRIAEGANYAIRQLEEVLRPDSDKFNEFVQIKGRYNAYLNAIVSGMASKAELDGQYNQISTALLYFTDSLREEYLRTEQPAAGPAQTKRGELLYHIPHEMQTAQEYKCAVRVAYLRALLYEDWQRHDDDVQKSIPVAEIMSVELLNQDGSEPFEIRSFSDTIQFLDQDFHTEWAFYVKPRRIGAFPLLLKISVVETRNGRDVKRNIVLEERVVVSTDAPLEVETNFQKSDIRLDLSGKEQGADSHEQAAEAIAKKGPTVNPSNSNRPLRVLAFFLAFLMLGGGASWAFTPPSVRDWWVASLRDSVEGYTAYIEKHRDTGPANPRLETAYFRKADKTNLLSDLHLYQEHYPNGKYEQVVAERIARLEGKVLGSIQQENDGATDTIEPTSRNSDVTKTSDTSPQFPESSSRNNETKSSLPNTFTSPTQPAPDSDGDGVPDTADGCPFDENKTASGACGCGKADIDSDGDRIPDCKDGCPTDKNKTTPGICGCGKPDIPDCDVIPDKFTAKSNNGDGDDVNTDAYQPRSLDTTTAPSTIAFGSCNKINMPQTMWANISANNPNLWIWLGDIIYADTPDMKALASHYKRLKTNPEYKKLRAKAQIVGVYDDHDYGTNDASKDYPNKRASKKCLMDFLDVPVNSPVRKREGAYQSYTFGKGGQRIRVIILDTRYFRDALSLDLTKKQRYIPNMNGDMLGEVQWKWLEKEMNNSPANLNILCSSVQVLADEHGLEKWGNFPNARKRLLSLIAQTKPKNLLILSGDRHMAEISKKELQGLPYPLYDFTSSGLTHIRSGTSETNHLRIGDLIIKKNFGLLKIRWDGERPIVTMQIRGSNNELFQETVVRY